MATDSRAVILVLSRTFIYMFAGSPGQRRQVKADEIGVESVRVYGFDPIATDVNARIWLNYKYTFPSVSFSSDDWSAVKDKIVIIRLCIV